MIEQMKRLLRYTFQNTQARLVLFLTLSVFCIILGVGITSYSISKNVLQEELSEPQYQMLQIGMDYIDEYIRESNMLAVQISLHPNVYEFFKGEVQNNYDNITRIYDLFTTLIRNTPVINSIYMYDLNRGSFLAIPQGYSSSALTFVDSQWIDIVDEFGEEKMVVRKRSVPAGEGSKGSEITLFRKIIMQGEFLGVVALNLKEDELFSKLHPPQRSQLERSLFILDGEGQLLYANIDNAAGQGILDSISLQESDKWTVRYDGHYYLVNQLVSPVTGWRHIAVISQDSLLRRSTLIRDAVLAVSIIALVFGISMIVYLQRHAFMPVRRMLQLFRTSNKDSYPSDLHYLERVTADLVNHHTQLSQLVIQTIPDAASKFLFDIYIGNMSSMREFWDKWNRYFRDWKRSPFLVVMISIDRYDLWRERYPSSDHSLLKFALGNVLADLFSSDWKSISADFGKDKLAVLLQPLSEQSSLDERCEEAVQIVHRLLGFEITIGISKPLEDLSKLKQAMAEAENALSYRLFRGYGQVIRFAEVSSHEMPESGAVEDNLQAILEAVESGDPDGATQLLNSLTAEMKHGWYPSAAITSLKTLAEKLADSREDHAQEPWEIADLHEDWSTMRLEDIEQLLSQRIGTLAGKYRELADSKDFVLCQRMIEYMKQHLQEPIGVEQICEAAGISVSLASQIFKKEMDDTIYGYLTRLRMDRAGELLVETDYRISDIASQVGYLHENSFIRVFRKYKDITPGKYRELIRLRNEATGGN